MQCPKCAAEFTTVTYENIEVNLRINCKGLWLDELEKEDLKNTRGSENIDIGDEQTGEEYNHIRKINCPHCDVKMLAMIDKDQVHI